MIEIFIAYPSKPPLGETMRQVQERAERQGFAKIKTWERQDLAGNQLIAPIIQAIKESDIVVADFTSLNFNVTYELGFALGLGKRVLPIRNSAYDLDAEAVQRIGIFDTILYEDYSNSEQLLGLLARASAGQRIATNFPLDPSPLYIVLPSAKTDDLGQIRERAQRAGLRSRVFDPVENPRLGATEAIRAVAASTGVIVPLLAPDMREATIHNIRAAFVAGVAHALDKSTLILRSGDWAVPLDVRDDAAAYHNGSQLAALIATFAGRVHDVLFSNPPTLKRKSNQLSTLNLGDPSAENEEAQLDQYFLERAEYRQVLDQRANIVVGRKGSGKTAVFVMARDHLKADRAKVVVDLNPETHQLKRLKDFVLSCLAAGSKEFLLSAFWEYVLLLEIANKIIDKDADVHKRNHILFEPYQKLLAFFRQETSANGVDFSDRLRILIERLSEMYQGKFGSQKEIVLSQAQLTNLLYQTTLANLKGAIEQYAKNKKCIVVLFDNLDKGWNFNGLEDADVIIIRTLLDAGRKLENDFRRVEIKFHCTVFMRNDIYDILLSRTSDRGKETRILLDWPQPALLKQMIRRRLQYSLGGEDKTSVDALWYQVCVAIVNGENSLDYLVRHSLMRPRYLLRLINHCIGNAVNYARAKVDEDDIRVGIGAYSTDIVTEIDLEIRDVLGRTDDVLYVFLGEQKEMRTSKIKSLISSKVDEKNALDAVYTLLIWHGVLGLKRPTGQATYIYDVNYDIKRMLGLILKADEGDPIMELSPGLWAGLELT